MNLRYFHNFSVLFSFNLIALRVHHRNQSYIWREAFHLCVAKLELRIQNDFAIIDFATDPHRFNEASMFDYNSLHNYHRVFSKYALATRKP